MTALEKTLGAILFVGIFLFLGLQIKKQNFQHDDIVTVDDNARIIAANDAFIVNMEKQQKLNKARQADPEFQKFYQEFYEKKLSANDLEAKIQKYLALEFLNEGFIRKMFDVASLRDCNNDYIKVIAKFKMKPAFLNNGPTYLSQNALPDKKECAETLVALGMYKKPDDIQKLMSHFP